METLGFNSPSLNPENCRLNGDRKSHYVRKIKQVHIVTAWVRMDFLHEVHFSAAIGAAHFPADLRNAALSAFEEGAPFMGTALAAYKQCIGPRLSAIFAYFFQCFVWSNIVTFVFLGFALFVPHESEAFFSLGLFRPSKMVAEIYWQSDERASSRR